jgi:cystathionine gamma-synthase
MTARLHYESILTQARGSAGDDGSGAIHAIELGITYKRDPDMGVTEGVWYSRPDNPCYRPVEALITRLERAEAALVTASGTACMAMIFQALTSGDHVLIPHCAYSELHFLATDMANYWGIRFEVYPTGDVQALHALLRPGQTKIVWVEAPSNPELIVPDIAAAAQASHSVGARLVVDATLMPPPYFQPLSLGADLVIHSASKFLNGHSDVVAGTIATGKIDDFWEHLCRMRYRSGAVLGPFETWLLLRGMRTLHLRLERGAANAQAVADFLRRHDRVRSVCYPGLIEHPTHELAKRQMRSFGAMVSFHVDGGDTEAAAVWARTKVFKNATSLGAVDSLIEHRFRTDGYATTPVPPSLLRLSVGLEDVDDLIDDLDRALSRRGARQRGPGSQTKMAQGLGWVSALHGSVVIPLYLGADPPSVEGRKENSAEGVSAGNPTIGQPEALLADLEGAASAMLFTSRRSAVAAVFQTLSVESHVVIQDSVDDEVRDVIRLVSAARLIEVDWVEAGNPDSVSAAVRPNRTRLVWLESLSTPMMIVTDIEAAARVAHAAGALCVVDNTVATPLLIQPLSLGADLIVHGVSMQLNGHGDTHGGVLAAGEVTPHWEQLAGIRDSTGCALAAFESWLLMRSLRTLGVRAARANANAAAIAEHLTRHAAVSEVLYPGLPNSRTHTLARRQMTGGYGSVLSVRLREGEATAQRAMASFRVFRRSRSVGSLESLAVYATSACAGLPHVPTGLIRLSVGVEYIDDLIADLDQALSASEP